MKALRLVPDLKATLFRKNPQLTESTQATDDRE